MTKKQELQELLAELEFGIDLDEWDLEMPDDLDEKYQNGLWELSADIIDLNKDTPNEFEDMQTLLYHLLRGFLGNNK